MHQKQCIPEIEGLSINSGFCEKGSDIIKASLHHSQMQSWGDKDTQNDDVIHMWPNLEF